MEKFGLSVKSVARSLGFFIRDSSIYPKSSIDYQICTACENKLKASLMYESLISIKDQFTLFRYPYVLYIFLYCALLLFFRRLFKIFQFLTYKFNKDFFEKIKISINILLFVVISILLGWP